MCVMELCGLVNSSCYGNVYCVGNSLLINKNYNRAGQNRNHQIHFFGLYPAIYCVSNVKKKRCETRATNYLTDKLIGRDALYVVSSTIHINTVAKYRPKHRAKCCTVFVHDCWDEYSAVQVKNCSRLNLLRSLTRK